MTDWTEMIDQVVQMDAEAMLGAIPDEQVDLIVTSPPYNCRMGYGTDDDQVDWIDYYIQMDIVLRECYRVLRTGGVVAVNVPGVVRWQHQHRFANTWSDYDGEYRTHRDGLVVLGRGRIEPVGFRLFDMMRQIDSHMREPIVWVKGGEESNTPVASSYQMGCDSDPYMRPCHELILLGSKGQWFHRGGTGRRGKDAVPFLDFTKDVWWIPPATDRRWNHPATFPVEIPTRLIKLFCHAPDSLILDPFMGSGTTAIAAYRCGYRFIGAERQEKFCTQWQERLNGEQTGFDLSAESTT